MLFEGISPLYKILETTESTGPTEHIPTETKQVHEGMEIRQDKRAKSNCNVKNRASKKKSKPAVAEPYREKAYVCTFCEKKFANQRYLKRHAKRMHREQC